MTAREETLRREATGVTESKGESKMAASAAGGDLEMGLLESKGEADAASPSTATTFTESLKLDKRYHKEFLAGNFLYLRHKKGTQTAYNLETCEHYETNPANYFTMSRAGITHFVSSEPEFTSLEQWEREYYLFNVIRKIPFFTKYRSWKTFKLWKSIVRHKKSEACAAKLNKELFFLSPLLRNSMFQVRKLCAEVSNCDFDASKPEVRNYCLFDLESSTASAIEDFVASE